MNAPLRGKLEAIVDRGHHLDNGKGAMPSGRKLCGWLICYVSPLDWSGLLTGYDYGPKLLISHGLVIKWRYHMYDSDSFLG